MRNFNIDESDLVSMVIEKSKLQNMSIMLIGKSVKNSKSLKNELLELIPKSDILRVGQFVIYLTNNSKIFVQGKSKNSGRGYSLTTLFAPQKCFDDLNFVASALPALHYNDGVVYKY